MKATLRSSSIAVLLLLAPVAAEASAPDLFGFGARGFAMASTLTATASGSEAVYYNPAGLAFATRSGFSMGFQSANYFLSIDGEDVEASSTPALTIGIVVPLPFQGILANRFVIGFGFVLPQTSVLLTDIPRPQDGRFVRLNARAETVSLMGGMGIRIIDGLSIGAGFIALSELEGAIEVAPNAAGQIGSQVKDQLVADYAAIAGVMWQPARWLSLGFNYRGQSDAQFTLPISASLGDDFPLPIPLLDISGTAQFDPQEFAFAAAGRPTDNLLIAFAAVLERWSLYENPIVFTAVPDGHPPQPPPSFSDVFAFRLGAELDLKFGPWRLLPRAGVALQPSPTPAQDAFHNYYANARVITAAGASIQRWGLHLDAGAQWHALLGRTSGASQLKHGGSVIAYSFELGVEL